MQHAQATLAVIGEERQDTVVALAEDAQDGGEVVAFVDADHPRERGHHLAGAAELEVEHATDHSALEGGDFAVRLGVAHQEGEVFAREEGGAFAAALAGGDQAREQDAERGEREEERPEEEEDGQERAAALDGPGRKPELGEELADDEQRYRHGHRGKGLGQGGIGP